MTPIYRVILSAEALADLEGISAWITGDSAEAAAKVIERLLDDVDSLQQFPELMP